MDPRQDYFFPDNGANNIHILKVSNDGTLGETFTPVSIPPRSRQDRSVC